MAPPDERNYSPGPLRRGEPAPDAAIEYDDEDPDSSEQLPYMHLDDFAVLREGGDRGRNKMASVEEIDKEDTATGAYRPLYATGRVITYRGDINDPRPQKLRGRMKRSFSIVAWSISYVPGREQGIWIQTEHTWFHLLTPSKKYEHIHRDLNCRVDAVLQASQVLRRSSGDTPEAISERIRVASKEKGQPNVWYEILRSRHFVHKHLCDVGLGDERWVKWLGQMPGAAALNDMGGFDDDDSDDDDGGGGGGGGGGVGGGVGGGSGGGGGGGDGGDDSGVVSELKKVNEAKSYSAQAKKLRAEAAGFKKQMAK